MILAVALVQFGFRIEEVHLAGTAVLKEADHGFRARAVMRAFWREWRSRRRLRIGPACFEAEQMRQGKRAKAAGRGAQKGSAVERISRVNPHKERRCSRATSGRDRSTLARLHPLCLC